MFGGWYLELVSLRDEEIGLREPSFGVQNTLLLVVVIHHRFAHKVVAGLGWRAEMGYCIELIAQHIVLVLTWCTGRGT